MGREGGRRRRGVGGGERDVFASTELESQYGLTISLSMMPVSLMLCTVHTSNDVEGMRGTEGK